jgi:hypothetical protein
LETRKYLLTITYSGKHYRKWESELIGFPEEREDGTKYFHLWTVVGVPRITGYRIEYENREDLEKKLDEMRNSYARLLEQEYSKLTTGTWKASIKEIK